MKPFKMHMSEPPTISLQYLNAALITNKSILPSQSEQTQRKQTKHRHHTTLKTIAHAHPSKPFYVIHSVLIHLKPIQPWKNQQLNTSSAINAVNKQFHISSQQPCHPYPSRSLANIEILMIGCLGYTCPAARNSQQSNQHHR